MSVSSITIDLECHCRNHIQNVMPKQYFVVKYISHFKVKEQIDLLRFKCKFDIAVCYGYKYGELKQSPERPRKFLGFRYMWKLVEHQG